VLGVSRGPHAFLVQLEHGRKPVPDSVRMLVRERARNAWK
jgi:hypothetical protein